MAADKLNFLLKRNKEKKLKKIDSFRIDGKDRIWLKIQGELKEKKFDPENEVILLGGKAIEPMLSYVFNAWNIMLPYVTYASDKEKVESYIKTVRFDPVGENRARREQEASRAKGGTA